MVAEELLPLTCNRHRFPNPVPSQIRVPQWALLDVTVCRQVFLLWHCSHNPLQNENLWNANKSYSVGGEYHLPYPFFVFPLRYRLTSTFFEQTHQSSVLARLSAHQACPRPPAHLPPYPPRLHPQGTTRAQSWVASLVVLQQSPSPLP